MFEILAEHVHDAAEPFFDFVFGDSLNSAADGY
jgi:hypothetical protein